VHNHPDFFKDKKITVMGLGLLGRGVGDTAYLAKAGAEVIVTDLKSEDQLGPSLEKLREFSNITYRLGEHKKEDFLGRDMILKAAGVPLDSPYIELARKDGAEIAMSGALFSKLSGIPIIGITGTRGKSTVTHMVYHVLTQMTEGEGALLGGNVRGVSNLELLSSVKEESIAVMELDSWQLQGFGEYKMSPQIAVFTNFMEDHMNYYKNDMGAYFKDKAQIFAYQEQGDVLVTTKEVFEQAQNYMKSIGEELHQDVRLVDSSILPEECLLSMPGEHNRTNAALALETLRAVGMTDEEMFEGLASFPGVPGRLEYLGIVKDTVGVFNDNNSTTPSATAKGIESVAKGKNVILIAGGTYKGVAPDAMISPIEKYCKKVILLEGTGTDLLKDKVECEVVGSLGDAVAKAVAASDDGDIILFSPGFTSHGMFQNEYERNDMFVDLIKNYQGDE